MEKLTSNSRLSTTPRKFNGGIKVAALALMGLLSTKVNAQTQPHISTTHQAKVAGFSKYFSHNDDTETFHCGHLDDETTTPKLVLRSTPCAERDTIRSVGIDFSFNGNNLGFGEKWESYTDSTNYYINQIENTAKGEGTFYHNQLLSTNTVEIQENTPLYDYFNQDMNVDKFRDDLAAGNLPEEFINHLILINEKENSDTYNIALPTSIGGLGGAGGKNWIVSKGGKTYLFPQVNIIKVTTNSDKLNAQIYMHEMGHGLTRLGNQGAHMNTEDGYPPNIMNQHQLGRDHVILPQTIAQAQTGIPELLGDNEGVDCSDGTVGTGEVQKGSLEIMFYPNPNNQGIIHLTLPEGVKITTDRQGLFDTQGKLIKQFSIENESTLSYETQNLPNGIYIMQLTTNRGTFTDKIVIANY